MKSKHQVKRSVLKERLRSSKAGVLAFARSADAVWSDDEYGDFAAALPAVLLVNAVEDSDGLVVRPPNGNVPVF